MANPGEVQADLLAKVAPRRQGKWREGVEKKKGRGRGGEEEGDGGGDWKVRRSHS